MTFSIVARCARTGQLGAAALTAEPGVGKLVTHAAAGVGAIASQATMNPYLGVDGLRLLARDRAAADVLDELVRGDPGRETRQCAVIDRSGRTAAWTGSAALPWAGHLDGPDCAAQGNRLVGRQTLEAVVEAFCADPEQELAARLLQAVEAGEATGADREGALSATIYVVDTEEYPLWDVRVDLSDHPAVELRALFDAFAERLVPQVRKLPTRADPMGRAAREQLGA